MTPGLVRFDCYDVDIAAGQIYRHGRRLRLPEQSFRVLSLLLERAGRPVTRDELRDALWPGEVFVDFDNILNSAVARLRDALHDSADRPRFIETLPKRGYRFIGEFAERAERSGAPASARHRLLVLPFDNVTGDAGREYVADGLTEEVITQLGTIAPASLAVIARTTAMRYKAARKDLVRVGRELRVDSMVEGAIRREGRHLALNVQLVRVSDQAQTWAHRYEMEARDVTAVAEAIAEAVAGGLGRAVNDTTRARDETAPTSTADPAAYTEYIEGRRRLDRAIGLFDASNDARRHLERAVALDPDFVMAHEALAHLHWFLGYNGMRSPADAFAAGILHVVRAMEVDNRRAETRSLLAAYRRLTSYDWPEIERETSFARELDATSPVVRMVNAITWLMPHGRLAEAIAELEGALETDPLSYALEFWLGVMHVLAWHWPAGLDCSNHLTEWEPGNCAGRWLRGVALRGMGRLEESLTEHYAAVELSSDAPPMLGWLGLALGSAGMTSEAGQILGRLEAMSKTKYVPPSMIAWTCLGMRQVDRAFDWMDRAVDVHDQLMMPIKSYAFLDPLRAHPRYAALLRKMRLEA